MSRSRIVIAPDSFKGSATAQEVAESLAAGWRGVRPDDELVLLPMADGGEGTIAAMHAAVPDARSHRLPVSGPLGAPVEATWLMLPDGTAVVEAAEACGITLLDPLDARGAHSAGLGELIFAALDGGARRILIGVGGTASNDGGAGLLAALGARLVLGGGARPSGYGNGVLAALESADLSGLQGLPMDGAVILNDVDNPLLGERGAIAVFGPQKGATPEDIPVMEAALAHWAALAGLDSTAPGGGAGGGIGAALHRWGAEAENGALAVAEAIGLPEEVQGAALVITGEGRYDVQSAAGKVPMRVQRIAQAAGVPTALVAGAVQAGTEDYLAAYALTDLAGSVESAIAEPQRWLREAGRRLAEGFAG